MATKFKIVGQKLVRRIGRYDVPIAAVELAEDIYRLELIHTLLKRVEPQNCGDSATAKQRDTNDLVITRTLQLVRQWQRHAKRKLATEYLAQ